MVAPTGSHDHLLPGQGIESPIERATTVLESALGAEPKGGSGSLPTELRFDVESATELFDETRRRFEASERRFDDLRNRGRGIAAAIAALVALDLSLLSTFADPAKNAPVISAVLIGIAMATHTLLLRSFLRIGYSFEPARGLPDARKVVKYSRERGHAATLHELTNHYATSTHELDAQHARNAADTVTLTERLIASLVLPVLAALVYASRLFSG
jgi:hypothetical protein